MVTVPVINHLEDNSVIQFVIQFTAVITAFVCNTDAINRSSLASSFSLFVRAEFHFSVFYLDKYSKGDTGMSFHGFVFVSRSFV